MVKPAKIDTDELITDEIAVDEAGQANWTANQYRAAALNVQYEGKDIRDLLSEMIDVEFAGRIALVSSFGTQSAVLLALVSEVKPNIPVLFIDTGKLFSQTIAYRDQLIDTLKLTNVDTVRPDPKNLAGKDPFGALWMQDTDACCHVRKVLPLASALQNYDAWISGRKRYQSDTRSTLEIFEADGNHIKINPLAAWSKEELADFAKSKNLPDHPLLVEGYRSVGCAPCTQKTPEGADERAGRWAGQKKTECGIHLSNFQGMGI